MACLKVCKFSVHYLTSGADCMLLANDMGLHRQKTITFVCFLRFILFSVVMFHSASATTTFLKNETDSLALLAFKKEMTGDPFHVFSSWNDSFHFCQWRGVTCSRRHQRVTALDLHGLGLVGHISTHLANLTFLRSLNVGDNHFHGEIPKELGRLFRLRFLLMQNNSLGGEIPANLSQCFQLRNIDLSHNELVNTIPPELGSLSQLVYLRLYDNNLSGAIPTALGNLSSLNSLHLRYNNLQGRIPQQLGQFFQLRGLYLGVNNLFGEVPNSIYNLSSIQDFELASNQLIGSLPSDIGMAFPNLVGIAIGGNQLRGPIPVSFANAFGLKVLGLASNHFVGPVPIEIGKLQNLTTLYIGGNDLGSDKGDDLLFITSLTNCSNLKIFNAILSGLQGLLPDSIANLSTSLVDLELGQNRIYGTIPSGIANLINLQVLSLEFNSLIGSIPAGIVKLRWLEGLTMGENKLSGTIPASMGNLTQLVQLDFSANQLQGIIPPSLANCTHLQDLRLFRNRLTGVIPNTLFKSLSLLILFLSHNYLTGSVPMEVGNLANLYMLSVGNNQLSGEIPESLGKCIAMETLTMSNNFFEGPIPMSLSDLRVIKELDVSHNKMSGRIPKFFTTLIYLVYLNLSFNNFGGEVPKEGIFKNRSAISLQGNTNLCGGVLELYLPPCSLKTVHKHDKALAVKLIVSLTGSLLLVLCLLVLLWKRMSRKKPPSTSSMEDLHMKISYQQLLEATNGFSSANLIGVGSLGSVYKGILNSSQDIAVKVLNLVENDAMKSFTSECEALRNIRHRNLVKILTYFSGFDSEGKEFRALVFELMSNGTLESWLHPQSGPSQSRSLNLKKRLDIAIDVAHAFDYLHNHCHHPIVHCDLKPNNVLLDGDMVAHVSDFGLAKIQLTANGASSNQSSALKLKGTIGYIPPEYGIGGEVTTRGDAFSYGVLLLEMFTGRKPTDDMFKDGLTLSEYAKMSFPKRVMEIVDTQLVPKEGEDGLDRIQHCLVSVIRIGITCSSELAKDRMDMRVVQTELELAREVLGGEIHMEGR